MSNRSFPIRFRRCAAQIQPAASSGLADEFRPLVESRLPLQHGIACHRPEGSPMRNAVILGAALLLASDPLAGEGNASGAQQDRVTEGYATTKDGVRLYYRVAGT